jgi:hypothetical protein
VPFPSDIRAAVTNQNALSSADLPLISLCTPSYIRVFAGEKRKRRGRGEEEKRNTSLCIHHSVRNFIVLK